MEFFVIGAFDTSYVSLTTSNSLFIRDGGTLTMSFTRGTWIWLLVAAYGYFWNVVSTWHTLEEGMMLIDVGTCDWNFYKWCIIFGWLTNTSSSSQRAFDFDELSFEKIVSKVFLAPLSLVDDHSMLAFTTTFGEPCVATWGVTIGGVIIDVGTTCGCLVVVRFSLWPSSLKGAKTRCWNLLLDLPFL